jgi:heparosan-N-sulfate-glucuronate 5-epimerase
MSECSAEKKYGLLPKKGQTAPNLALYPVDIHSLLAKEQIDVDQEGIPLKRSIGYHPTIIAQYALMQWNHYLASNSQSDREAFLHQACWLMTHAVHIAEDASGWPIRMPCQEGCWLSATTQGLALSVLTRAYQLTQEQKFLALAHRVILTFERDILDGGICTPVGEKGIFFEERAVYPAAHAFDGFCFALFGLYDYLALTNEEKIRALIRQALSTLHMLLDEFDDGYWTHVDLSGRQLSSPAQLSLQTTLLEILAIYSNCTHCRQRVLRWRKYQHDLTFRLTYLVRKQCRSLGEKILNIIRSNLFSQTKSLNDMRICVPITAFPFTGGMRTILVKIEQVMAGDWQMEYLTGNVGADAEKFTIYQFGHGRANPWEFPYVWLYVFEGFWKLFSLLRQGKNYTIILPQDGVYTSAFAALAGKLAGKRVVCIDHGNLDTLRNAIYRKHIVENLAKKTPIKRIVKHLLLVFYWPSLKLFALLSARLVDHYCVPGVAGDGIEEICKWLGIGSSSLTRFVNAIDLDRYCILDAPSKIRLREEKNIPADAIVVATICRLTPEKGVDIAIKSINYALTLLPSDLSERVRFIIVGDGALREQLKNMIHELELEDTCILWGEVSPETARLFHGLSDIYLYTGTRGGGHSLAILEAMASGCAVIASEQPLANVCILAEGRGITVPVGDIKQTGEALVKLISDSALRHQMGVLSRRYVEQYNTDATFKRVLLRVTCWSGLGDMLDRGAEQN